VSNALTRRIRTWWQSRLPAIDTWTLTQRNIYIVPTRAGFMFLLVLVVMLLASINYQLSLGYVLTFLLAGAGFVSMHLTHNTLRGLTLHLKPPPSGFAEAALPLEIVVSSPKHAQYGVGLGFDAGARDHDVFIDVPAGAQATAHLTFTPPHRGLHTLPLLRAQTLYPLGLFRAWTVWRPASSALAWPVPEHPAMPLPASPAATGASQAQRPADTGEFDGVRSYRRGDAMKRIVWKKVARTGELVSRDASNAVEQELWLEWQQTQASSTEARLSRLAAWVMVTDGAGLTHGMRLPGVEIAPSQGMAHRRRSLDALAKFP
jgi:uncharacterized protein (DUF58 family)